MASFPHNFEVVLSLKSGFGAIGMMVLPLATETFRTLYGWRGAALLLASCSLHSLVAGALLRTSDPAASPNDHPDTEVETVIRTSVGDDGEPQEFDEHGDKITEESRLIASSGDNSREARPADRTGEIYDEESCTGNNQGTVLQRQRKTHVDDGDGSRRHILLRLLEKSPYTRLFLQEPVFLAILIISFAFGAAFDSWVIFLVPNGISKGYSPERAVLLTTIGGFGNILGRFSIGSIARWGLGPNIAISAIVNIACGVAFFANGWAMSYWTLAVLAFVNGFMLGGMIVISLCFPRCLFSGEESVAALSWAFVAMGLGGPLGGGLSGMLFDATQSFFLAFSSAGIINIIAATVPTIATVHRYAIRNTHVGHRG